MLICLKELPSLLDLFGNRNCVAVLRHQPEASVLGTRQVIVLSTMETAGAMGISFLAKHGGEDLFNLQLALLRTTQPSLPDQTRWHADQTSFGTIC